MSGWMGLVVAIGTTVLCTVIAGVVALGLYLGGWGKR